MNVLTAVQKTGASSEVILAEVCVAVKCLLMSSVGVVCRLLLCTGCQRAACSVIWKWYAGKLNCFLCWLRLTVYICSCFKSTSVLADWRLSNTEQFPEMLLLVCSLKVEKLMLPVFPTYLNLPLPCTYCLRLPVFPKLEFVGIPNVL